MSYEATIYLCKDKTRRVSVDCKPGEGELFLHFGVSGGSAYSHITPDQARELAHALLDAAQEAEPQTAVEVTA